MSTADRTVQHPERLPRSTDGSRTAPPPSAPVRSLSALGLVIAFYSVLVVLTLAYALSMGNLGP